MGEAKRRRLSDANYGQPKIPDSSEPIPSEVQNIQTPSQNHFTNFLNELPSFHLNLPAPSNQNNARQNPNSELAPNHWHEWVIGSAVDPILTELNVHSVSGNEIYEYLVYALPQTARRNDGRLREGYLQRYAHINNSWWASGLDPLNNWLPMEWGRMKPDYPRLE